MFTLDARGLNCPEPVFLTKKALQTHQEGIDVLVDDRAAIVNFTRLCNKNNYKVVKIEEADHWKMEVRK